MIKEATFISVWDDGIEIATDCKVDMNTKEVFNIEMVEAYGVDILDKEYVIIDGVDYPVSNNDGWYSIQVNEGSDMKKRLIALYKEIDKVEKELVGTNEIIIDGFSAVLIEKI